MRPLASLLIALAIAVAPQTAAAEAPAAIHTLLDLSFAECHNPRALAVGSTGWIYAAGLSGNVCGIAPWGQLMGVIPVPPGPAGVSNIFGALYESRSALYLTDMADYGASHAGRVLVVSPRNGAVRTLTAGLDGPNGIAQDRDRMLFVADSFAGAIYKVNPDTGQRALWTRDPRLATGGFPPLGASGLSPAGALVARYAGADEDALDFPAGLAYFVRRLYVTSFAFTAPGTGKVSVLDAPYRGARVRR